MSWSPYCADAYLDFDEVEAFCRELAAAHPDWVECEEVGTSREGRPILLLTVGAAGASGGEPGRGNRPAIWLDAGTHAAEWTGVSAVVYVVSQWIERLTEGDAELEQWFRTHDALVMPCISPDGYQAMHDGAPFLRSTLRPPSDGTVRQGLDPCDIDGDGAVRMMRWKHPAGSFVEDPDWAPFLRPRRLDDDPEDAYFLCDEGEFINWDGVEWTRAPAEHGLDLNRNFPSEWEPFEMFGMDSGAYPLSEPESRAAVDAFADHPHIGCALTMHTYTGCVLTQPYREETPLGDEDIETMELFAEDLTEGTGYDVFQVYPEFMYEEGRPIPGVWADTISTTFGVPGYTVELWDPFDHVDVELDNPKDFFQDPDREMIRAFLQGWAEDEENVREWEAVDHPQLGEVEVGGLERLRTVRNPPPELLREECERAVRMVERTRGALPEVQSEVHVEQLDGDARRVRLVLENRGYWPTSGLQHGRDVAGTPEVGAQIHVEEGRSVDGPERVQLDHMDGWGNLRAGSGRHPEYAQLSDRGHRSWVEWRIRGEGPVEIEWVAGRGGRGREVVDVGETSETSGEPTGGPNRG